MASPQPPPPTEDADVGGMPSTFERGGWRFESVVRPMWSTDRLTKLVSDLGIWSTPDMFFGDSVLRIIHQESNWAMELSPIDALRCCSWSPAPPPSLQPCREAVQGEGSPLDEPLFGKVQCQFARNWKANTDNPDVKEVETKSDWTFSTAYWGSAGRLASAGAGAADASGADVEVTEQTLPMDLLRQRDEILWYGEVVLWEHELDDCGLCRVVARVRVMPTFWFALLSHELRVDGVLIRDVGTRMMCRCTSSTASLPPCILREWTWREASYELLRQRSGLDLSATPHITGESIGTALLKEEDVKRQLRHEIRLRGASEAKPVEASQGSSQPHGYGDSIPPTVSAST